MKDNSQILTYSNCELRWWFQYGLGLKKIEEDETEHHRNFGGAAHSGLDRWFRGLGKEAAISAFKEAYPEQLDEADLAKTQTNGIELLERYFSKYSTDLEKYEILGVEERIDFKVGEHDFCVKNDTVILDKKYGQIFGLEHKTTGKTLNFNYWARYNPNSQLCAQTAAIKHKYGSCAGIMVDAMSFGYRQRAYKGEPAGFHCDFQRLELNINEGQLSIWERSTIKTIEDILRDLESKRFSMNTDQCQFCSYKPICQAGWTWEDDEELIRLAYEQVDPLAYLNLSPTTETPKRVTTT